MQDGAEGDVGAGREGAMSGQFAEEPFEERFDRIVVFLGRRRVEAAVEGAAGRCAA
jgi:hypothetical protein